MSNDPEFDSMHERATGMSRPMDDSLDTEEWLSRMAYFHRNIYRAGARAALNQRYGAKLDPLDRLRWLADHDFLTEDIKTLLAEAEDVREKSAAFTGMYGITESDLHSMLAEGFHTAFRKASDHPYAVTIHKLIKELPAEHYSSIISFVADPIIKWLREAEAESKKEDTSS